MLKGVHLTLMIGPGVPVPVPRDVLESLTEVSVTTGAGVRCGFELKFTLSNRSPLHTLFLVAGGAAPPIMRVILVATINGQPEVLIDGVMTQHDVSPGGQGGMSVLSVKGDDLTRLMDYVELNGLPYAAVSSHLCVLQILAKYLGFGIIPLVIPAFLQDVEPPLDRVPIHRGTDLDYLRRLARHVGHVFYLEPGPAPGATTAYWGPEVKSGPPQPALNLDLEAARNVETLNFSFRSEEHVQPVVNVQLPLIKFAFPVPIPDIGVLNPPLGLIPPIPKRIVPVDDTGKLTTTKALLRGLGAASRGADQVTARGTLDVVRYGRALKARRLVGVRGAGHAFDGLYFVKSVTHRLQRGSYKQDFVLSRNGLVSTLPRVPA